MGVHKLSALGRAGDHVVEYNHLYDVDNSLCDAQDERGSAYDETYPKKTQFHAVSVSTVPILKIVANVLYILSIMPKCPEINRSLVYHNYANVEDEIISARLIV